LFSKILVPLDGSEYSQKALDMSIDLAKKYSSTIIIVHVIASTSALITSYEGVGSSLLIDLRKQLDENSRHIVESGARKTRAAGVSVTCMEESGNPPDKILELAENIGVDLIVIGDRGLSVVARFFLGSVADKVSRHCKCPILIVKTS
jgi:nucleotide-binding universal stress UspA family protein